MKRFFGIAGVLCAYLLTGCGENSPQSVNIDSAGDQQVAATVQYEAENATLSGSAAKNTNHTGYSGSGFVDGFYNSTTAQVSFTVTATAAGSHQVKLRFCAGNGTSTNTGLYVNGTKIKNITCPTTGNWNTWADEIETVTLNAGNNTIAYKAVTSSGSCINIDMLTVTGSSTSYTITFNKNDAAATGTMANQTIAGGTSANLNANAFAKTGTTFAGWATSATGTVVYANQASYTMGTANVTLYAKWTPINTYTVTFNKNDASATGTMTNQTITSGTSANLTANAFAKAGSTFAGWATSATGAVAYADRASYTMGTANVTLYAKWTVLSSTTYEAENATLSGSAAKNTNHTGYSGTGFVDGFYNSTTAQVSFSVTAASAGSYQIKLRFCAGNGTSTNTGLYVNGTKIKNITCPTTGNWNTWADEVETVTLNAGNNTVAYKAMTSSGTCINLDRLTVTSTTTPLSVGQQPLSVVWDCNSQSRGVFSTSGNGGSGSYSYQWFGNYDGSSTGSALSDDPVYGYIRGSATQTLTCIPSADRWVWCRITDNGTGSIVYTNHVHYDLSVCNALSVGQQPLSVVWDCNSQSRGVFSTSGNGGSGSYSYQWFGNYDGSSTGSALSDDPVYGYIRGSATQTLTCIPSADRWVWCRITDNGTGNIVYTNHVHYDLSVCNALSVGQQPLSVVWDCNSQSRGVFSTSGNGGSGSYSYQWFGNYDGSSTGSALSDDPVYGYIRGSATQTLTCIPSADRWVWCRITDNGTGNIVYTNHVHYDLSVCNALSVGQQPLSVVWDCNSQSRGVFSTSGNGGSGSYSYQWFGNYDGSSTGSALSDDPVYGYIRGSATQTLTCIPSADRWVWCRITDNGTGSIVYTNHVHYDLSVCNALSVGQQPLSVVWDCNSQSRGVFSTSGNGGSGSYSYQWFGNYDGSSTGSALSDDPVYGYIRGSATQTLTCIPSADRWVWCRITDNGTGSIVYTNHVHYDLSVCQ